MKRRQEFVGVRCIEAADAFGKGEHLYSMHLTDDEIVRCRECRRFAPNGTCGLFDDAFVEPGGFCSWAERDGAKEAV